MRPRPQPALVKWWKYRTVRQGEITRTLSPFQQDVITPLFKNMPQNAAKRVSELVWDVGPAALLLVGTVWWADSTHAAEAKKHWH